MGREGGMLEECLRLIDAGGIVEKLWMRLKVVRGGYLADSVAHNNLQVFFLLPRPSITIPFLFIIGKLSINIQHPIFPCKQQVLMVIHNILQMHQND
jgi:hypothetical protein